MKRVLLLLSLVGCGFDQQSDDIDSQPDKFGVEVPAGTPVQMAWPFHDSCGEKIIILLWNSDHRTWGPGEIWPGEHGNIPVDCRAGETVCFGAVGKTSGRMWGSGDGEAIGDWCAPCAQGSRAVTELGCQ